MTASKLQPTLLAGLFIGVLSALPVISVGNCLCCLWVVSGGVLASYLLQQNQQMPIDAGDGAIVGLMSGLLGAVIATLLYIPIQMVMGPLTADMFKRIAESAGDVPPEFRQLLEQMAAGEFSVIATIVNLIFYMILFSVFGLLGGLLGQALFKSAVPPPPPTPSFLEPMH